MKPIKLQGLRDMDIKHFSELIKIANDEQLKKMINSAINEQLIRQREK